MKEILDRWGTLAMKGRCFRFFYDHFILSMLLLCLCLLSKPTAITLIILMAIIDYDKTTEITKQ